MPSDRYLKNEMKEFLKHFTNSEFISVDIETAPLTMAEYMMYGDRKMPSKYAAPPDLSRSIYLIGFFSANGYSGGVSSPGFYMMQNFRQPYYNYDEAVAAASKIAASEGMGDKQVFVYRLCSKVELEPVKPPVRVIELPVSHDDYRPR